MKAISSPDPSSLASRTMKLVGVILILSFLVDFAILLFPAGARDRAWLIAFASEIVNRGVIPMVGLALLFGGYWVESSSGDTANPRTPWVSLKFWALVFASILGLLFLLIFPLHLNNVRLESASNVERVKQEADQAENRARSQIDSPQAKAQIENQQSQFKSQVSGLLQDPQKLNQTLQNDKLPDAQKKLLQQFKSDPKSLDQYIQQNLTQQALLNRALTQIREKKEQVTQQTGGQALKSGLQVGISSLLLAVGYIVIGWTGLRSISAFQGGRRKSPAR